MKIQGIPLLDLDVTIRLNEKEARALVELSGYGVEAFLKTYYNSLGRSYLEPHEDGIRSLFESIKVIPPVLARMDRARKAWNTREEETGLDKSTPGEAA